jgi:prepilin-type N-terminal cleavage/methylation domain-containing protein
MLVPRSRRGFSLIELLIVIAIILLIITIAVPKFNSVQKHAREVAAMPPRSPSWDRPPAGMPPPPRRT